MPLPWMDELVGGVCWWWGGITDDSTCLLSCTWFWQGFPEVACPPTPYLPPNRPGPATDYKWWRPAARLVRSEIGSAELTLPVSAADTTLLRSYEGDPPPPTASFRVIWEFQVKRNARQWKCVYPLIQGYLQSFGCKGGKSAECGG